MTEQVLIRTLPRGKKGSKTCCDDENARIGGNTSLPEQLFIFNQKERICRPVWRWYISRDSNDIENDIFKIVVSFHE